MTSASTLVWHPDLRYEALHSFLPTFACDLILILIKAKLINIYCSVLYM